MEGVFHNLSENIDPERKMSSKLALIGTMVFEEL
jgi:hypothetical protein